MRRLAIALLTLGLLVPASASPAAGTDHPDVFGAVAMFATDEASPGVSVRPACDETEHTLEGTYGGAMGHTIDRSVREATGRISGTYSSACEDTLGAEVGSMEIVLGNHFGVGCESLSGTVQREGGVLTAELSGQCSYLDEPELVLAKLIAVWTPQDGPPGRVDSAFVNGTIVFTPGA